MPENVETFIHSSKYTCKEMSAYLWSMNEAHEHLTPKIIHSKKSELEAERFRVARNKSFQMKDFDTALSSYNKSIMAAPHPPHKPRKCDRSNAEDGKNPKSLCTSVEKCNLISETPYKSLALAFANRSAVLFEQKEYKESLADIELALQYGYPKELQGKLAFRKAKCLFALKRHFHVEEVVKTSLKELQFTTPNEAQYEKTKKEMSELLEKCHLKDESGVESIDPFERDDFRCQPCMLPKLQEVNSSIPVLSSSIKMSFSSGKQRSLMAVKDIRPGDLLSVEEPFSWSLVDDEDFGALHCSTCLRLSCTPLPCPHCSLVIFCCKSCLQEGLQGDHGQECSVILPTLSALGKRNYLIITRIMKSIPFRKLREMIPQLHQEAKDLPPETRGFNENEIYDSKDYRTVHHFVNNMERESNYEVSSWCQAAFIVTKILEQSQQFFTVNGKPFKPTKEDILLTGETVMRHLLSVRQNCLKLRQLQGRKTYTVGDVIFPVMSLANHSCNPSAKLVNLGKYGILRALRSIPAGQEVTVGYQKFSLKPRDMRKTELLHWHFKCYCEACVNDWPILSRLPDTILLKCTNSGCDQLFKMEGDCPLCFDVSQRSRNDKMKSELDRLMFSYAQLLKEPAGSSELLKNSCDLVEFMDKNTQTLCRFYYALLGTLEFQFTACPSFSE